MIGPVAQLASRLEQAAYTESLDLLQEIFEELNISAQDHTDLIEQYLKACP